MPSTRFAVFAAIALVALPVSAQTPLAGDAAQIYRTTASSVFLIELRDARGDATSIGSAFLIGDGRLVTNAHVVTGGTPYVKTGAVAVPVDVELLDNTTDLAVLRARTELEAPPLALSTSTPEIGAQIFAIGNPQGLERTISEGIISARRTVRGGDVLQITAPISPGSSGGPIVDANGAVVGVTVAYLEGGQNLNFAIPADRVRSLLDGKVAPNFPDALAEIYALHNQPMPELFDHDGWDKRNAQLSDALQQAGSAARTGDEFLAVATAAWVTAASDRELGFYVTKAIERGTSKPDSARLLMMRRWDLTIAFNAPDRATIASYRATVDSVLLRHPNHPGALYFKAVVLEESQTDKREALSTIKRALDRVDEVPNPVRLWVAAHRIAAAVSEAEDDAMFSRLVSSDADRAYDWSEHAKHRAGRDDWQGAGEAYWAAFSMRNTPEYACNAGSSFYVARDHEAALATSRACIDEYARSTEVDSVNVSAAHRVVADILRQRGVFSSAESHARQARLLQPMDPWSAHVLAEILLEQQRYSEAATLAEEAIRLSDGRYSSMHFTLGSAYFELSNWSRCERAFRTSDSIEPSPGAVYNRGLCLARQGYYADAADVMSEVLRRYPNHEKRASIEENIKVWRR